MPPLTIIADKDARIILGTHVGRPKIDEASPRIDLLHN